MKREDIARIFDGASEEQVKALLDINSADITKALNRQKDESDKLQTQLDAANDALKKANDAINDLKNSAEDAEKLKQRIADYEKADADRQQAEKAAAERAELEERFGAVSGDRQYIHDMVREGVLTDFGKALADKANRGKSDAEIFEAITRDKGFFASQNPPAGMGPMNNIQQSESDRLSDADYYAQVFAQKK